jgi:hypothetical protein
MQQCVITNALHYWYSWLRHESSCLGCRHRLRYSAILYGNELNMS